mmetsp:Transcript_78243/g.162471  ORF Transcript_78243/g.162471 Transcript_78243/m.162471 type:complete len:283 (-) Transcript_78243:56-904(-)
MPVCVCVPDREKNTGEIAAQEDGAILSKCLTVGPLRVRRLAGDLAGHVLRVERREDVGEEVRCRRDQSLGLLASSLSLPLLHRQYHTGPSPGHGRASEVLERIFQHTLVLFVVWQQHYVKDVVGSWIRVLQLLKFGMPVCTSAFSQTMRPIHTRDGQVGDPHTSNSRQNGCQPVENSGEEECSDHDGAAVAEEGECRCHAAEPRKHFHLGKAIAASWPRSNIARSRSSSSMCTEGRSQSGTWSSRDGGWSRRGDAVRTRYGWRSCIWAVQDCLVSASGRSYR